jgi:hypothetical protein
MRDDVRAPCGNLMQSASVPPQISRLAAILDEPAGRYRQLNGGRHLGEYLERARTREDEEILTEPIMAGLIERVLGFPSDTYFPQLGRSGLKPDFTPIDLVAHRFVLDAKSSTQDLVAHERQIRAYIDQRRLDYGVLFNLRHLRVYRRGGAGHDAQLSFDVLRLWQVARGEALDIDEVDRFLRFCSFFGQAALLASDERYGIVPLDAAKQPRFDEVRRDGVFDLVIGNPPYVFESGNKVLFDRLRALPGWRGEYRGKSDYLYYFLAMAAEKVAPGGRLCVITPAGWMNAGNADWLRERIASMLRLDELYLFGSMRLFATEQQERDVRVGMTPPTVESAILVAAKTPAADGHRLRVVLLEDEAEAARTITGDIAARTPPRAALLEAMASRVGGRPGRAKGILLRHVVQEDLRSNRPWPIKHAPRDVAARVVAHLQTCLDAPASRIERLAERWNVVRGMETGADAYSARVRRRLPDRTRSELAARGHRIGDPILELSPGAEREQPWCEHPRFLARSPEPRALLYGTIDEANYTSLVWLRGDDDPPADIIAALEPWREVLRTRAEFARNPRRMWWETAWPRARETLTMPKVIALYRTDRGRFALDESGAWQPSNKTTIATARRDGLSVAYLCGLLNSELLDLWYAVRGKTPRDIWRNYEPKPMNEMPYRHVPRPAGWTPSNEVAELAEALAGGSSDAAVAVANLVRGGSGRQRATRTPRSRSSTSCVPSPATAPPCCHCARSLRSCAVPSRIRGGLTASPSAVQPFSTRCRRPRSARCALTPSSRWSSRPTACSDALVCGTGRSSSLTDGGRRQASTAQPIVSRSWPRRSDRSGCFPMTCAECACR